jgi:DNA-binding HxlR family transcriptional regulator
MTRSRPPSNSRRTRRGTNAASVACAGDPVELGLAPRRYVKVRFATCPMRLSLGLLGRKWALLILRNIAVYRIDRFNRLLESLPGIPPKVLSTRLRELESLGFLVKVEVRRAPKLVRWDLTERGRDLLPAMMMLAAFHSKWDPDTVHPGRLPMRVREMYDREAVRLLERFL